MGAMHVDILTELTMGLYLLMLAIFIGFELISKVPTMLHTPLMSGSNAISGIIVVGGILVAAQNEFIESRYFAYVSIFLATVNVVGGFVVTDRMLGMFKKGRK